MILLLVSAYALDPRITALARTREAQLSPFSIVARTITAVGRGKPM
jgi:hypothetical protein